MTPELGQGAGTTPEDAVVLATEPTRAPVPQALAACTAARLPRTTAIATRSRRAGRVRQLPYPVQGLAARLMGVLPGAAVVRGPAPVLEWQPPR